jgi:hypothetical protein
MTVWEKAVIGLWSVVVVAGLYALFLGLGGVWQ